MLMLRSMLVLLHPHEIETSIPLSPREDDLLSVKTPSTLYMLHSSRKTPRQQKISFSTARSSPTPLSSPKIFYFQIFAFQTPLLF